MHQRQIRLFDILKSRRFNCSESRRAGRGCRKKEKNAKALNFEAAAAALVVDFAFLSLFAHPIPKLSSRRHTHEHDVRLRVRRRRGAVGGGLRGRRGDVGLGAAASACVLCGIRDDNVFAAAAEFGPDDEAAVAGGGGGGGGGATAAACSTDNAGRRGANSRGRAGAEHIRVQRRKEREK